MATKRDFYEILSVPKNASDEEIKKSYRKLAMKYHPDRNQGDASAEVKFKEAKEAYEMLSDAEKRAAYDQYGHAGVEPSMRGAAGAGGFGGFGESFGDIFGDIFGQARRQQGGGRQVFRGNDLSYAMDITLEEAAAGKKSEIRIPSYDECDTCHGSGAKPGTSAKTCGTCQGQGVVQMRQGFFSVQQTCPHCRGSGKIISDPCSPCHGQGKIKRQKTLEISIPAGIDDGMRIRSSGNGEPGTNGGPPGDLYIEIRLQKHEVFQRDGMWLAVTPYVTVMDGEVPEVRTVRFRTVGDASCTGAVESSAATATASLAPMVVPPATCTLKFVCKNTRCSSATATTCIAPCPSVSPPPLWVVK